MLSIRDFRVCVGEDILPRLGVAQPSCCSTNLLCKINRFKKGCGPKCKTEKKSFYQTLPRLHKIKSPNKVAKCSLNFSVFLLHIILIFWRNIYSRKHWINQNKIKVCWVCRMHHTRKTVYCLDHECNLDQGFPNFLGYGPLFVSWFFADPNLMSPQFSA